MELIKKIGMTLLGAFTVVLVAITQAISEVQSFFQKD